MSWSRARFTVFEYTTRALLEASKQMWERPQWSYVGLARGMEAGSSHEVATRWCVEFSPLSIGSYHALSTKKLCWQQARTLWLCDSCHWNSAKSFFRMTRFYRKNCIPREVWFLGLRSLCSEKVLWTLKSTTCNGNFRSSTWEKVDTKTSTGTMVIAPLISLAFTILTVNASRQRSYWKHTQPVLVVAYSNHAKSTVGA